jgi:transglutaminase-like putative cysteine protease
LVGLLVPAPQLSPAAWPWLHGAVLAATGVTAIVGTPTAAFAGLVAWLLVHRSWTGRRGDDVRVALLLATLLLLLGAVRSDSVALAPLFAGYGVLLPIALLRAELQDTGEAAPRPLEALVALGAAGLAALLFVVLPRLDGGYLGSSRGGIHDRFPEDVTLGVEGLVSDDLAEVLRARVTAPDGRPVAGPFHFRGRGLERFDGTQWVSTGRPEPRAPETAWDTRTEVSLAPTAGVVLFGVPEVIRVDGVQARREAGGTYVDRGGSPLERYVAYGHTVPLADIATEDVDRWLQLPTLDPRVIPLAWSIASEEGDPVKVAEALTRWLSVTYPYVPNPPPPVGDPLAWFLFEEKQGHCEYFASALTVLLRVRGIPARMATGFYSGELADDGSIVVRRGHAHAWVEVRTKNGWATLDPTPDAGLPALAGDGLQARFDALVAGWYRDVVEYDMNAQFATYGAVGRRFVFSGDAAKSPIRTGLVGMVVVLGALVLGLVGLRFGLARLGAPHAREPVDPLARLVKQARAVLRRRGWDVPRELPVGAAAEWLAERVGDEARPLARLAELVYASRYGGAPSARAVPEAKACVAALRRIPRRRTPSALPAPARPPAG